jgi:hypothetical protein
VGFGLTPLEYTGKLYLTDGFVHVDIAASSIEMYIGKVVDGVVDLHKSTIKDKDCASINFVSWLL